MTAAADTAVVLGALGTLATAGTAAFIKLHRELRAGRHATEDVAAGVRTVARAQLAYEIQAHVVATLTAAAEPVPPPPAVPPAAHPLSTPVEGHTRGKHNPAHGRREPDRRS